MPPFTGLAQTCVRMKSPVVGVVYTTVRVCFGPESVVDAATSTAVSGNIRFILLLDKFKFEDDSEVVATTATRAKARVSIFFIVSLIFSQRSFGCRHQPLASP